MLKRLVRDLVAYRQDAPICRFSLQEQHRQGHHLAARGIVDEAAAALHFAFYNFVRRHSTIKTTPALAAGVADHRWSLLEFVELGETYGR